MQVLPAQIQNKIIQVMIFLTWQEVLMFQVALLVVIVLISTKESQHGHEKIFDKVKNIILKQKV